MALLEIIRYISSGYKETVRVVLTTHAFFPKAMRLMEVPKKSSEAITTCMPPCIRTMLVERKKIAASESNKSPTVMEYGNHPISKQGIAHFVNKMLARLGSNSTKMKALVAEVGPNKSMASETFLRDDVFNTSAAGHVLVFAHRSVSK